MCGIVGIVGVNPVAGRLVASLKRLEYRGYDSAGIATLQSGEIIRRRAVGKLGNLEALLETAPLPGHIGIGHTRWATHGGVTEANAHPHVTARVAVVHNGIIENFRELRDGLIAEGYRFQSETDTEVVAVAVSRELDRGKTPRDAVRSVLPKLTGAFALAFLFAGDESQLIGARRGPPLAIGFGQGEMYFGSDAIALAPLTNRVTYLEDGDWAVITRHGAEIFDEYGDPVKRPVQITQASSLMVDKGNHRHFMAKEIHEQPEVVGHTLAAYLDFTNRSVRLPNALPIEADKLNRVTITACGTAFYAGLVAKYWIEQLARVPVEVDIASEFRYRESPLDEGGLTIVISQSGETADTLAALRYAKASGNTVAAVVNVPESTIARESDVVLPTLAGPEIGVASTKAFTCQLAALAGFAVWLAEARGKISPSAREQLAVELAEIPRLMAQVLKLEHQVEALARKLAKARDALYLGRGTSHAMAMEGALKLKEISYIHAEGYAAGELKHGPIALVDENVPVIVVAPYDGIFEKTVSNMQEVAARGGRIILLTDARGAEAAPDGAADCVILPDCPPFIAPLVYAPVIQMLAYHAAVFIGTDVDQPRNLAKSVTVE